MKDLPQHVLDLLFPRYCLDCNRNLIHAEHHFCRSCLSDLFYLMEDRSERVEKLLLGKVNIDWATAMLPYSKRNITKALIHQLKYRGSKDLGELLGRQLGKIVEAKGKNIDFIVPVPLHKKKLKVRGFNQAEVLANGLSQKTGIPISTDNLHRTRHTKTQTKKSVYDRHLNVHQVFALKNLEEFAYKNILLVDDVITTGSTLEGCIGAFHEAEGCKVSVATAAVAV